MWLVKLQEKTLGNFAQRSMTGVGPVGFVL